MKDRCEIVINLKSKMRIIFLTLLAALMGVAQVNAQTIVDTWQIGSPNATDVTAKFSGEKLPINGDSNSPKRSAKSFFKFMYNSKISFTFAAKI